MDYALMEMAVASKRSFFQNVGSFDVASIMMYGSGCENRSAIPDGDVATVRFVDSWRVR